MTKTPKQDNPKVQDAKTTMQVADLAAQLQQAEKDKENVAADAQRLRVLLQDKDKELAAITESRDTFANQAGDDSMRIGELEEQLTTLEEQIDSIENADPTRNRPEIGKYAATIFAGILQAQDKPEIGNWERNAAESVRGAICLSAALDKEFGCTSET